MKEPKLSPRYKLWAKYYLGEAAGNAEKAAVLAGYSKNYARSSAYKIMARTDVQEYMQYLMQLTQDDPLYHIADIKEIQAFWTTVMNDESARVRDRLKASELLAKVQGAFRQEDDDW